MKNISPFQCMHRKGQDFIIKLTEGRKLFWRGRWHKSTTLRDSRKGKVKMKLSFRNRGQKLEKTVYISHLNVKITAGIYYTLVYSREAIKKWFTIRRQEPGQLEFDLAT